MFTNHIAPDQLLTADGTPRNLGLVFPISLTQLANDYGLKFSGEDIEVSYLLSYPNRFSEAGPFLSYFDTSVCSDKCKATADSQRILIVNESDHKSLVSDPIFSNLSLLVTSDCPKQVFCTILNDLHGKGQFELLLAHTDAEATVAKSAIIHSNVYISKGAVIGESAVILPNTFIGEDVIVSPNATIGTDSIGQFAKLKERTRVSHVGGVWLSDGVEVGPVTCIDRGISGEFTFIGRETKVDNLIHIASGATIGSHVSLPGSSYVGNDAVIEDGAWIGPKTAVEARVRIGANAYVGTGCLIATNQPSQSLVYGVNSRAYGWACYCRNKLEFNDGAAVCGQCGKKFQLSSDKKTVVPV